MLNTCINCIIHVLGGGPSTREGLVGVTRLSAGCGEFGGLEE